MKRALKGLEASVQKREVVIINRPFVSPQKSCDRCTEPSGMITPDEAAAPLEIEQHIRSEAQRQVRSLHRCFDPLPLACQRPGYVGVTVSLAKDGEVRSYWVSRSTYGKECPVSQCMANVVSGWFFDSMPEAMKVVIPIQVRRTSRPLYDPHPVIAQPLILADPNGDAGALEVSAEEWAGR